MNFRSVFLILIFVIVGAIAVTFFQQGSFPVSRWETYRNEEFGFEIRHPEDWQVAAFPDNEIAPIFNVYKKSEAKKPPFIHHDAVVQVSVFPRGVPTEGIIGEIATSTVQFSEEVVHAVDYVLSDGSRWATVAGFADAPAAWQGGGLIFSRVSVDNEEVFCVRDGREIPEQECDPFGATHDIILRRGMIDGSERRMAEKIMASFRFLSSDGKNGTASPEVRTPGAYDGCLITGCSGQVCADDEVITTCEYRPEYACFQNAVCERNESGMCGFRESKELQSCLAKGSS